MTDEFFFYETQLNEEAASLDWTKSQGYTLSGRKISNHYDEEVHLGSGSFNAGQKLGGASRSLASARASSVAAAYSRFLHSAPEESDLSNKGHLSEAVEPDPDDAEVGVKGQMSSEPDPDDAFMIENYSLPQLASSVDGGKGDPDGSLDKDEKMMIEPDPDDSVLSIGQDDPNRFQVEESARTAEPIDSDTESKMVVVDHRTVLESDDSVFAQTMIGMEFAEPDPDDSSEVVSSPDDSVSNVVKSEPDPDDHEDDFQRIEEPVAAICSRIQRAIKKLQSEASPVEASSALQTLVRIIRFVLFVYLLAFTAYLEYVRVSYFYSFCVCFQECD